MPSANSGEANSCLAGAQRVSEVDGRRGASAAVLVKKAEVGRERAGEREQDAEGCGHKREGWTARAADATIGGHDGRSGRSSVLGSLSA